MGRIRDADRGVFFTPEDVLPKFPEEERRRLFRRYRCFRSIILRHLSRRGFSTRSKHGNPNHWARTYHVVTFPELVQLVDEWRVRIRERGVQDVDLVESERLLEQMGSIREQIVRSHLRLVSKMARDIVHSRLIASELLHAACIALLGAVDLYRPSNKARFTTFLFSWVRKAVLTELHEITSIIHTPRRLLHQVRLYEAAARNNGVSLKTHLTALGLTPKTIHSCLIAAQSLSVPSLDIPEFKPELFSEALRFRPHDECDRPTSKRVHDEIERCLEACLTSQERQVIMLRFGFDGRGAKTLVRTGACMGLSRERIRQIEVQAKAKIKRYDAENGNVFHQLFRAIS